MDRLATPEEEAEQLLSLTKNDLMKGIETIDRRNYKTKAYWMGGKVLCVGLILYCASVSLMLLNPH